MDAAERLEWEKDFYSRPQPGEDNSQFMDVELPKADKIKRLPEHNEINENALPPSPELGTWRDSFQVDDLPPKWEGGDGGCGGYLG